MQSGYFHYPECYGDSFDKLPKYEIPCQVLNVSDNIPAMFY